MKDYLADLVKASGSAVQGRNIAREYLQARILSSLQRAGAMVPLAFHGGTALRLLYSLPRYSEDLDFALERPDKDYDVRGYLRAIRSDLSLEGYEIDLRMSENKVVHSAFVRFRGLLYELDLSPHTDETLAVKIEVDTNPPSGAILETRILRKYVMLHLQHHDQASLLAGKLHAILQRTYTKGRDIYDLFWYLSDPDWPKPNIVLLNNALQQTGWSGDSLTDQNWQQIIGEKIEELDWNRLILDVRPFLENQAEVDLLSRTNLRRLLGLDRPFS